MTIDADRVRRTVAHALGADESTIRPETRLSEITELDSLSLVEVASALDDDLGIHLSGDTLSDALTVADLAELARRAPRR